MIRYARALLKLLTVTVLLLMAINSEAKIKNNYSLVEYLGSGKASKFGGPNDPHMSSQKTAICKTPGNKLNPNDLYCAYRWDYNKYGENAQEAIAFLNKCKVRVVSGDKSLVVKVSDWGPGKKTKRIIDLSPGAMKQLGISTDKEKVDVYLLHPYVK